MLCCAHDQWVRTAGCVQLGDSSAPYGVDQGYLVVLSWQLVWSGGPRRLSSLRYFGADGWEAGLSRPPPSACHVQVSLQE